MLTKNKTYAHVIFLITINNLEDNRQMAFLTALFNCKDEHSYAAQHYIKI
ncbi:MAG: hypothetical protein ACTHLE_14195 [Agriterribacter sp.]